MMSKTRKHVVSAVAAGFAAAALYTATPAAAAFSTGMKDIFDHPDGVLTSDDPPVSYGLRLDVICYWVDCGGTQTADEKTFSVESSPGVADVWLDWGLGGTDFTKAQITGTVHFNDEYPSPAGSSDWTVDYNLENIQSLSGSGHPTAGDPGEAVDGWYVTAENASGSITRISDGLTILLRGKEDGNGHAFVWDDDGHRCGEHLDPPTMCATDAEIGRGWMEAKKDGTSYWKSHGSNDWLIIGKPKDNQEVPEPGTLALFGLGLVGLRYARRRRMANA